LRNIGVPLAHSLGALKSLQRGIQKLAVNRDKLNEDLENNWAVVAEAIQTILRRESYPQPYEALKTATRGKKITKEVIFDFIDNLNVSNEVKNVLKQISPQNYVGIH
jgi:adenylosuccinate lyase